MEEKISERLAIRSFIFFKNFFSIAVINNKYYNRVYVHVCVFRMKIINDRIADTVKTIFLILSALTTTKSYWLSYL